MNFHLLAAKYRMGLLTVDELTQIGVDALLAGFDSPSLCQLAGENGSDSNLSRRLFEKSLAELEIAVPTQDEAGMIISKSIAQEVISGKIGPYEGARRIWNKVYVLNPNLKALTVFVGLASELEDHPENEEAYLAEIKKECRLLVEPTAISDDATNGDDESHPV